MSINNSQADSNRGYIVKGLDEGGFRDFLDEKAIHSGALIDWWSKEDKSWIAGRYEMDYHSQTGYFYPQAIPAIVSPAVITIDRENMIFRWPQRDNLSS